MYPAASKYSMRPSSPTFVNFSPPSDYPSTSAAATNCPNLLHHHHHPSTTSMKHMISKASSSSSSMSSPSSVMMSSNTLRGTESSVGGGGGGKPVGGRSEIMFPDDSDSIEFCIRGNMIGCPTESFTERRRRGHSSNGSSRRSNHKMDVEQQVKWTRKNIAATMERFEPSPKSDYSSSCSSSGSTIHSLGYPTPQQQQLQPPPPPPVSHVYSYAYYEPGAAKCHTNIPQKETSVTPSAVPGPSKSPPRNSIRALLAKSFRSKTLSGSHSASSSSAEERHTYTTRYGTQENLYEEVNDQKIRKVLSDNRIVSGSSSVVKEELRRVQHNHFRVLDELNLSLEALIMPPTPPDISPTTEEKTSHASMENISSTLNSIELKDHTCINPEFDEGDLDSGFSGSGSSSGASYNESLRYYKTGAVMQTTTLPHMRSCRSSNTSTNTTSTSKSSMISEDQVLTMSGVGNGQNSSSNSRGVLSTSSPFNYIRRCSDSQRSSGVGGGVKPKKNFWTIKQ